MKKTLVVVGALIAVIGAWFYMKQACVGLYHEQSSLVMVQDESGVHEIPHTSCLAPFQKYPDLSGI
jgi:uncharacterized protein YxeA